MKPGSLAAPCTDGNPNHVPADSGISNDMATCVVAIETVCAGPLLLGFTPSLAALATASVSVRTVALNTHPLLSFVHLLAVSLRFVCVCLFHRARARARVGVRSLCVFWMLSAVLYFICHLPCSVNTLQGSIFLPILLFSLFSYF